MCVSTAPAFDEVGQGAVEAAAALGAPERVVALSEAEVAGALRLAALPQRRAHPRLRHAAAGAPGARPAPAADRARRCQVYERSPVRRVGPPASRPTRGASAQAPSCSRSARRRAPSARLRSRLTVTSSHIVLTEPVPDVIEELGWTGGECITDGRTLVHYFRTTRDGRILLGWGGGRLAYGARVNGRVEVDADAARSARARWCASSPASRAGGHPRLGRADRRLPQPHPPDRHPARASRVHFGFGFTGNGVGPTNLVGRTLASLATGARRRAHPPAAGGRRRRRLGARRSRSPGWAARSCAARWCAASASRRTGATPDPLTRAVCAAPRAIGMHLAR